MASHAGYLVASLALVVGILGQSGDLTLRPQEDPSTIRDHVSRGILRSPPDAFEGGHEQDRTEIIRALAHGSGYSPQYTDLVIQEARHFEREHGLESAVYPLTAEERAAKEKLRAAQEKRETKLTETVYAPGLQNMDSETGRVPQFFGEVSATSPTLHAHLMDGHKENSPYSPTPLYTHPEFRADLDALRCANGNYSVSVKKIAKVARDAVEATTKVFLDHVRSMFVSEAPLGKMSLANRSGFISAAYLVDNGAEFKSPTQGIGCVHLVRDSALLRVSELEAEHMCNEMGLDCSGYSCNVQGELWSCVLCRGVLSRTAHAWREIEKKPFFALKSPDHMEWDYIVRRSRQWVEKFASLQRQVEALLEEESVAMERRFQAILEHRAADPYYNRTNDTHIRWKVRLDSAWREEQYQEANWYAELMKAQIVRIDGFYNQVLNKLTQDVNMVNDKEQAQWDRIESDELANHSHAFDCWMAIRGVVYDFTYLTPHHPNKHSFIKYCGQDVSQLYEDLGHDSKTLMAFGKRVVGEFFDTGKPPSRPCNNTNIRNATNRTTPQVVQYPVLPRSRVLIQARALAEVRTQWRDFSSELEAEAVAAQHANDLAASMLDMKREQVGVVRPHRDSDARLLRREG